MREELHDFITDNNLIEDYVGEHLIEFTEFIQEEIVDEVRTFDYWKQAFCEENENDFEDFCEQAFTNSLAILETERSLIKD